jgi:hypothetical protein
MLLLYSHIKKFASITVVFECVEALICHLIEVLSWLLLIILSPAATVR